MFQLYLLVILNGQTQPWAPYGEVTTYEECERAGEIFVNESSFSREQQASVFFECRKVVAQ